jgi:ABC-type phosphate transport system ATPase subunit
MSGTREAAAAVVGGVQWGRASMTTLDRIKEPLAQSPLPLPQVPPDPEPSPDTSASMDVKLAMRAFHAYYGRHLAVRDINLEVAAGDITAIIGPSGCGKSTLLRSINRMNDLVPGFRATGSILLEDQDLLAPGIDVVAMRRRVGMLFQRPNPFPISIFDNVAYGVRLAGRVPKRQVSEIVESALERAASAWPARWPSTPT